jgi:hypothetical protein
MLAKLRAEMRSHVPFERLLVVTRVVQWIIKHQDDERCKRLMSLSTHLDRLPEDSVARLSMLAAIINRALKLLDVPDVRYVAVPFITTLLSTINVNSLTFCEEQEYSMIGHGLYLNSSLLNHSCDVT